jgi:spore coat polysaccharide biosynthesis protein SpsF
VGRNAAGKIVAIIQARMGSTRLPGKVLAEIEGHPMLWHVVQRVQTAKSLDCAVVATTTGRDDNVIADFCRECGFHCFRGSERDVLDRYYSAARHYRAEAIVRITSDCPLIDPQIVDSVVHAFTSQQPDYASNCIERTFPRGLDTEILTMRALESTWCDAVYDHQREHVTAYIYENPKKFNILSIKGDDDHSAHRWTVDTREDLDFVRAVYSRFQDASFLWNDVLRIIELEPQLATINSWIRQKAVHEG